MTENRLARLLSRRIADAHQPRGEPISVAELRRRLIPYPVCRKSLGLAAKSEYDLALLRMMNDSSLLRIEEAELEEAVRKELESAEPGLAFLRDYAAASLRLGSDFPAPEESSEGENGAGAPEPEKAPDEAPAAAQASGAPSSEAGATPEAPAAPGPEARTGSRPAPDAPAEDRNGPADALDAPAGAVPDEGAAAREGGSGAPEDDPEDPAGWLRDPPSAAAAGDRSCRDCGKALPSRDTLRFCPFCGEDQTRPRCGICGEEMDSGWNYCPACGEAAPF